MIWNYKTALLSALVRAGIFFAANARAGYDAAMAAMVTEFCCRFATSGFYGALTQRFRHVEPAWAGTLGAIVLLPILAHAIEFVVHRWRGTPELAASLGASIAFTMLSTAFNLFVMRRGALVVGPGTHTLIEDLRAMPRLVVLFVASLARACMSRDERRHAGFVGLRAPRLDVGRERGTGDVQLR
jgi:hypothetical protein